MADWAATVLAIEERERRKYEARLPVCESCGEKIDPALEEYLWNLPGLGIWCGKCLDGCRARTEDYI